MTLSPVTNPYIFQFADNTIQVANSTPGRPTTILRTTTPQFSPATGGKQIITVHKSGPSNQPQIVTLVKTTQGMTVAPVSYSNTLSIPDIHVDHGPCCCFF